jgi:hypothetical protein
VIINNFHILGTANIPVKADPKLIVDANAVLPISISMEALKMVAGWDSKIIQVLGSVECDQLSTGGPLQICGKLSDNFVSKNAFCGAASKTPDHPINTNPSRY